MQPAMLREVWAAALTLDPNIQLLTILDDRLLHTCLNINLLQWPYAGGNVLVKRVGLSDTVPFRSTCLGGSVSRL